MPTLTLSNPGTLTGYDGDSVNLSLTAQDSYVYSLSYSATNLPAGLSVSNGSQLGGTGHAILSGTLPSNADQGGPYSVTITATDTVNEAQVSQTFTLKVIRPTLTLTQPEDQTNCDGDTVSLHVAASENASHTLTYSESGLPTGLGINQSTGVIFGTVGSDDLLQNYSVTVTATDSAASLSASKTFTWTLVSIEAVLSNPGDQSNFDGDTVSLLVVAHTSYASAGTFIFGETDLPGGLSIGSLSGVISGQIADNADQVDPYSVIVSVNDSSSGLSATQAFNWTVSPVSVTLYSPGDQTNCVGDTTALALPRSDTANRSLTFTASNLPNGLSIDASTGEITGTIGGTAGADLSVTVTATDTPTGVKASQTFNWSIVPILIDNPGDQYDFDGDSVDLPIQIEESSASNDPLTFAETGSMPPGLTLNASSGVISGTILSGADAYSPYSVVVTVTDQTAGTSASQTINWYVSSNLATVALANPGDQNNSDGDWVDIRLMGFDSAGNQLTYNATGLPAGLNVVGSDITGNVASNADSPTPYSVTVSASDGGVIASQTFAWNVSAVTPTVSLTNPGNQSNFDGDTVNIAFTGSDSAGGTLTYGASELPAGLYVSGNQITGEIDGGDYTSGPYAVTLTATDSAGAFASQQLTWFCSANTSETQNVPSAITVTSSANPSAFGQSITLAAAVTGSNGVPTGTVTFMDGSTDLGTANLNDSAQATLTTSTLSIGNHTITAYYSGDDTFEDSCSADLAQVVQGGSATGEVWVDANSNGLLDSGEAPRANITVNLLNNGSAVQTTTTDGNGIYYFTGLDPRLSYVVQVAQPNGYAFTFYAVGSNPYVFSATGPGGTTASFQVTAGYVRTLNSGLINLGTQTTGTISGPATVPGDSQYTYLLVTNGRQQPSWGVSVVGQNCQAGSSFYTWSGNLQVYNGAANVTISEITLIFANNPAVITLDAFVGNQVISTQNICVVKVQVTDPLGAPITAASWANNVATITVTNSFSAGQTVVVSGVTPTAYNGTFTIATVNANSFTYALPLAANPGVGTAFGRAAQTFAAGTPQNLLGVGQIGTTNYKFVNSGVTNPANPLNPTNPGLGWRAAVTLVGPNNNQGVNMIHVGFIQHAQWNNFSGNYGGNNYRVATTLVGQSAIDIASEGAAPQPPWYAVTIGWPNGTQPNGTQPTFFNATQQAAAKTIGSFDTPTAAVEAWAYAGNAANPNLQAMNYLVTFTLDVAAETTDTSNGANLSFWGQKRAIWTFNASGGVAVVGGALTWTSNVAGANGAPPSWNTNTPETLMPETHSPTNANQLLTNVLVNDLFVNSTTG